MDSITEEVAVGVVFECNSCETELNDRTKLEYKGKVFCEDCYYDKFMTCGGGKETILRDSAFNYNGNGYCDDCFNDLFFICELCAKIYSNDDGGPDNLCQSCDYDDNK